MSYERRPVARGLRSDRRRRRRRRCLQARSAAGARGSALARGGGGRRSGRRGPTLSRGRGAVRAPAQCVIPSCTAAPGLARPGTRPRLPPPPRNLSREGLVAANGSHCTHACRHQPWCGHRPRRSPPTRGDAGQTSDRVVAASLGQVGQVGAGGQVAARGRRGQLEDPTRGGRGGGRRKQVTAARPRPCTARQRRPSPSRAAPACGALRSAGVRHRGRRSGRAWPSSCRRRPPTGALLPSPRGSPNGGIDCHIHAWTRKCRGRTVTATATGTVHIDT
jgi:hypothetical protein